MSCLKIKCRRPSKAAVNTDLEEDLRFYNCNRRVTRSFAKKMNLVSLRTIPIKKSEKYKRIKSDSSQNKRRKIEIDTNVTNANNEHREVKQQIPESSCSLPEAPEPAPSTIANADLTTEELQLFDSILDMMEEYGVIDNIQRPNTLEDIRDNFISDSTDLRRSLDSLMDLCKPDK